MDDVWGELVDLEKRIDRRQPALVYWGSRYPNWPMNVVADGLSVWIRVGAPWR